MENETMENEDMFETEAIEEPKQQTKKKVTQSDPFGEGDLLKRLGL